MRYFILLLATGCLSDQAAQQQWDAWVDDHNSCSVVEDCVEIYPGCPLGCGTPVSAEYKDEALAKSKKLLAAYEFGGTRCDYDCIESPPLVCEDQVCGYEGR